MKNVKILEFNVNKDERGSLVSLEQSNNIPFDTIKRVYYLYNLNTGERRGFHAHKKLEQVLVCVSGSCRILVDNGEDKEEVLLDKPNKGLFIGNMVWHEMFDFSRDCVLMVLASEVYKEEDYIRDYENFVLNKE
jgi:dTDP-4-dehydrorhamnose 3,5-epimerase-like enzyme